MEPGTKWLFSNSWTESGIEAERSGQHQAPPALTPFPRPSLEGEKLKKKQVVHFFFVPPLMLTLAVLLEVNLPPLSALLAKAGVDIGSKEGGTTTLLLLPFLPAPLAALSLCNWPFLVLSLYAIYYSFLDLFAGVSWTAFLALPMWLAATAWAQATGPFWFFLSSPAAAAGAVHLLAWAAQVGIGHAAIEGRRPALVDSFAQSVVLAGLFAWFELLFFCGYRPRLKREIDGRVAADAERRALLVPASSSAAAGSSSSSRVTRSRSGSKRA